MAEVRRSKTKDFNSHAHVERDPLKSTPVLIILHFNSHAHVERDYVVTLLSHGSGNFNSHAHVERDQIMVHNVSSATNFNSHAHVERDISADVFKQLPCISTHTLTWSVTCIDEVADQCVEISTHTLTWSVTSSSRSSHGRKAFQLTRSRGA